MGRTFVQATPTYIEGSNTPVTDYPFTMICWFYANNVTARHTLMSMGRASVANDYWEIRAAGDAAGDFLQFRVNNASTGGVNATTSNAFTASKWFCAIAIGASATDRTVYLIDPTDINDGITNAGTNTTSRSPGGAVDLIAMGRRANVAGNELDGIGAESILYNTAIAEWAVRLLGLGFTPFAPELAQYRGNLVWYKRLLFDDIEYPNIGGTWTDSSTAKDQGHPPLILPMPIIGYVTAAAGGEPALSPIGAHRLMGVGR